MKKKNIYKYYFVLLLIFCTWFSTTANPPLPLRLIFLIALFIPSLAVSKNILPPVLMCFTSLGYYGISASYMPSELYYYLFCVLIVVVIYSSKLKNTQRPPLIFFIVSGYIILVDLFNTGQLENIDYCVLILLLSFFLVSKNGEERELYWVGYIVVSVILCLFFFTYGNSASVEHLDDGRIMWKDPNYMGNVCGMGIAVAYNLLINGVIKNKRYNRLCILVVVVGLIMLVLNASRGALLSLAIAIAIITLFANIKLSRKIGFVVFLVLSLSAIYAFGLFDLLAERIIEDDGTGNNRTVIWGLKLDAFFDLPIMQQFFGIGYTGGFKLAIGGDGYGFHSDYVAMFVDYGFVGFVLWIAMMLYPIFKVNNNPKMKPFVISLVMLLVTCCLTLEPFTAGRLTYWYFYMFICLCATWKPDWKK